MPQKRQWTRIIATDGILQVQELASFIRLRNHRETKRSRKTKKTCPATNGDACHLIIPMLQAIQQQMQWTRTEARKRIWQGHNDALCIELAVLLKRQWTRIIATDGISQVQKLASCIRLRNHRRMQRSRETTKTRPSTNDDPCHLMMTLFQAIQPQM